MIELLLACAATLIYMATFLMVMVIINWAFNKIQQSECIGLIKAVLTGALMAIGFAAIITFGIAFPAHFIMGASIVPFVQATPYYAIGVGGGALGTCAIVAADEYSKGTLFTSSTASYTPI